MLLLDCILYNQCGAVQNTLFFVFRESSPTVKDREDMDGSTFFVCFHFRPRAGMATLTAMRRCSITGTNKMKKTLLFATALAATLAANAQNPIVPVQTGFRWIDDYIPKALPMRHILLLLATMMRITAPHHIPYTTAICNRLCLSRQTTS